ncbi:MAG: N-acetylmuramoyl-L-alanine amidase [Thermoanaerobaculia bacterium]
MSQAIATFLALVGLLFAIPSAAVEPPANTETAVAPTALLESGTAQASYGGEQAEIAWGRTAEGPLFALTPVARMLGADLRTGAGGRSYTLVFGGAEYVFGPETRQLVAGQDLVTLSQPPAVTTTGLLVPYDLLETVFTRSGTLELAWDAAHRRLSAQRTSQGETPIALDVVHLNGATTAVVAFPAGRPRFRVVEGQGWVEVQVPGASLHQTGRPPAEGDPLLRAVEVSPSTLRLRLAPGAQASHYTLDDPFRLVFDIQPGTLGTSDEAAATPLPAPPRPSGGVETIVIDPGHGGVETGAIGKGGSQEKELTLLLAQALKRRLEAELPVKVILTREDDSLVGLRDRSALANAQRADLFLSIHLNSSRGGRPTGAETYFLSLQASDKLAAAVAAQENPSSSGTEAEEGAGDLELILWDLAQSQHLVESQRLAMMVQEELNTALGIKDRGVKQAPFAVLMGATMPAVLVELGFLSNPEEEDRLKDEKYRQQLVGAVSRAVARYRAGRQPEPAASPAPAGSPPG